VRIGARAAGVATSLLAIATLGPAVAAPSQRASPAGPICGLSAVGLPCTLAEQVAAIRVLGAVAPQAGTFVGRSVDPAPNAQGASVIERYSLKTGRPLGAVASLPTWASEITGPYRARDGSLWVTLTIGPRYRNNTSGGDPAPDSCGGRVVRIAPNGGRVTVVATVPSSLLILDAAPTANGNEIVYTARSCTTASSGYLVVRDLHTGRQSSIGAGGPACASPGAASWSSDGNRLAAPWVIAAPGRFGCPVGLAQLAVVPANRTSELSATELTSAPPRCEYRAAAFDRTGIATIEACGVFDPPLFGPAYLVQLDRSHRVAARIPLEPIQNGVSISADPRTDHVLLEETYSPKPLAPSSRIRIWTYDGHHIRRIGTYTNPYGGSGGTIGPFQITY
jgi:hypothetical protein